jgi:hypothetical protein
MENATKEKEVVVQENSSRMVTEDEAANTKVTVIITEPDGKETRMEGFKCLIGIGISHMTEEDLKEHPGSARKLGMVVVGAMTTTESLRLLQGFKEEVAPVVMAQAIESVISGSLNLPPEVIKSILEGLN